MRFVLFSDLHLDTAFDWAPSHVAAKRRGELCATLTRIVELAEEARADALLCAGDLFEHDRFTPNTVAFLSATFSNAGRPVFLAPGNHDYLSPRSPYATIDWPEHVHVFRDSELTPHALDDGLTLWGAAHLRPAHTPGFFERGFRVDREGIHLGLFHGSERSQISFQGDSKQPHAPFEVADIEEAGLHHAFVGHFHVSRAAERLTYPGNPSPLSFGETGERGAVVVDVNDRGAVDRTWHQVSRARVHDVDLDVTGCASGPEVLEQARAALAELDGCVRLTLRGDIPTEVELPMASLEDLDAVGRHLDAVVARVGRVHVAYDLDTLATEKTVRGQFIRDVRDASDLSEEQRERILVTGLRALDGREDLEVQ